MYDHPREAVTFGERSLGKACHCLENAHQTEKTLPDALKASMYSLALTSHGGKRKQNGDPGLMIILHLRPHLQ